jgi:hypothetical protein
MSAFFWLPAIVEQKYVIFRSLEISDPSGYFFTGQPYLLLSLIQITALLIALWYSGKSTTRNTALFFMIISIPAVFMSSWLSLPLWQYGWAKLFQFPYRLLSLITLSGAYLSAYIFTAAGKNIRVLFILIFLCGFYISSWQIIKTTESAVRPESFYSTNEASTTVSDEYLPVWVKMKPEKRADVALSVYEGDGDIEEISILQNKVTASVNMQSDGLLELNKIYYPGWGVTVNGINTKIIYDNPYGLIRFPVPSGSNKIFAEFRETGFRFLSDIISLSGIIAAVYYSIRIYKKAGKI